MPKVARGGGAPVAIAIYVQRIYRFVMAKNDRPEMADKHDPDPLNYSESGIELDSVTINLSFAIGVQKRKLCGFSSMKP